MDTCDACKNNSLFPERYGSLTLCKKCAMKISTSTWRNKKYSDNDAVRKQCEKTLSRAIAVSFPDEAVESLKSYFDGLIMPGLFKVLDGGNNQKIVVKSDSVIIVTEENYDPSEARKQYGLVMSGQRGLPIEEDKGSNAIDTADLAKVAIGALSRGGSLGKMAMRAGTGIAVEMLSKSVSPSREDFSALPQFDIPYGEQIIKYENIADFEFSIPEGEETFGFLVFTVTSSPRKQKKMVFSFTRGDGSKKSVKEIVQFIEKKLDDMAAMAKDQETGTHSEDSSPIQANKLSAPDELLKWKQLLDVGAITDEEYTSKKKQLLGL